MRIINKYVVVNMIKACERRRHPARLCVWTGAFEIEQTTFSSASRRRSRLNAKKNWRLFTMMGVFVGLLLTIGEVYFEDSSTF